MARTAAQFLDDDDDDRRRLSLVRIGLDIQEAGRRRNRRRAERADPAAPFDPKSESATNTLAVAAWLAAAFG